MERELNKHLTGEYKLGFETNIESETFPAGLNIEVIKAISQKKDEPKWLLDFRIKAYNKWVTQTEPNWANIEHEPIDYQKISYFSKPKKKLNSLIYLKDIRKVGDTSGRAENTLRCCC